MQNFQRNHLSKLGKHLSCQRKKKHNTYVEKEKHILAVIFILTHIFLFNTQQKWKQKYIPLSVAQLSFQ